MKERLPKHNFLWAVGRLDQLGAAKDFSFKDHKRIQLKGFPERWRLWEVTWRSEAEMLPSEAIAAGATYIVVGRPITAAPNPSDEARSILEQMSLAVSA
jgi:hypothetical protein